MENKINEEDEGISDSGMLHERFVEPWGVDGGPEFCIPSQIINIGHIRRGEGFCRLLFNTTGEAFYTSQSNSRFVIKKTKVGRDLLAIYNSAFLTLREEFPDHRFTPESDLLLDAYTKINYDLNALGLDFASLEEAEKFAAEGNKLVESIRDALTSIDFIKSREAVRRACCKNMASMRRYVSAVVEAPGGSNLMALRLDLSYRKNAYFGPVPEVVPYDEVRRHRVEMLAHIKRYLGKAYAGYICKLEYGLTKGFHFHWLILAKRAYVRRDVLIGKALGQHWDRVVTSGTGMHLNCNLNRKSYRDACIGEVHIDDPSFWVGMKRLTAYLAKPDYHLKKIIPNGDRSLWRGEMPKERKSKAGRKRLVNPVVFP
ncbi:MAG: hypothetical protein AABZ19_14295 [Pseudomonadota bacterium]